MRASESRFRVVVLLVAAVAGCAKGKEPPAVTALVPIEGDLTFQFGGAQVCAGKMEGDQLCGQTGLAPTYPPVQVTVRPFHIDAHEVTNLQYLHCVDRGKCTEPAYGNAQGIDKYYSDTGGAYDNYPVVNVTWSQAAAYCAFVGKRLPTEWEWERAARARPKGTPSTQYPWGDTLASCQDSGKRVAIPGCQPGINVPQPVGSMADDVVVETDGRGTNQQIHDLGGNVSEWVANIYQESFPCGAEITTLADCENKYACEALTGQNKQDCLDKAKDCAACDNGTADCHVMCKDQPVSKAYICVKDGGTRDDPNAASAVGERAYRGGNYTTGEDQLCQARPWDRAANKRLAAAGSELFLGFRCARSICPAGELEADGWCRGQKRHY